MSKNTQLEINLGMDNNPFTNTEDITTMLATQDFNIFRADDIRFEDGEYNGDAELTAVIATRGINLTNEQIHLRMKKLCVIFNQECIAYKLHGHIGKMAYNPKFKGSEIVFNDKYFIDFYSKASYAKNFK